MSFNFLERRHNKNALEGRLKTNSYFQVNFMPSYGNRVKLAKSVTLLATHRRREKLLTSFAQPILHQIHNGYDGWATVSGFNKNDFRFSSVAGIGRAIEVEDIAVGGDNNRRFTLPNKVTYENLTLERGFIDRGNSMLSREFAIAMDFFSAVPGEILVVLMDEEKTPQAAWLFRNAYPVGWKNNDLSADGGEVFIETMEFAYSHFHQMQVDHWALSLLNTAYAS